MVIFADLQYTIYADAGRWMGLKIQKYADVILEWSPIIHSSGLGVKIWSKFGHNLVYVFIEWPIIWFLIKDLFTFSSWRNWPIGQQKPRGFVQSFWAALFEQVQTCFSWNCKCPGLDRSNFTPTQDARRIQPCWISFSSLFKVRDPRHFEN